MWKQCDNVLSDLDGVFQCQRKAGHKGHHRLIVTWNEDGERTIPDGDIQERQDT